MSREVIYEVMSCTSLSSDVACILADYIGVNESPLERIHGIKLKDLEKFISSYDMSSFVSFYVARTQWSQMIFQIAWSIAKENLPYRSFYTEPFGLYMKPLVCGGFCEKRYLTVEEFSKSYGIEQVCSYIPSSGKNAGKVCNSYSVRNPLDEPHLIRCPIHARYLKNEIEKLNLTPYKIFRCRHYNLKESKMCTNDIAGPYKRLDICDYHLVIMLQSDNVLVSNQCKINLPAIYFTLEECKIFYVKGSYPGGNWYITPIESGEYYKGQRYARYTRNGVKLYLTAPDRWRLYAEGVHDFIIA